MSFFVGSPFASPVGQRIEQATDASLPSENWTLNMEICDIINETEDGPKDAIKAIRKRLQQNAGKNYTVVMYTLTVLETCVKNCGKKFHVLACNKEFVQELVKLIGPKNDPPTAIQEKVLSLIQSWADAFRHHSECAGVVQVYTDLKQKGIEFPMTDLDTMAPIHTPQRSVPDMETNVGVEMLSTSPAAATVAAVPQPLPARSPAAHPAPATATLTPEQLAKIQSELDVVQGNMMVLSEMLCDLVPGKEHPSDMELLEELYATCQAMQHRLVELIGRLANDAITAELLRVNDELNNVFLRYSRFENNRSSKKVSATTAGENISIGPSAVSTTVSSPIAGAAAATAATFAISTATPTTTNTTTTNCTASASTTRSPITAAAMTTVAATAGAAASLNTPAADGHAVLIDLTEDGDAQSLGVSDLSSKVAKFSLNESLGAQADVQKKLEKEDTDFDMFAQSRNVTYESSKAGGSTYQDNLEPDQVNGSLATVAQTRSQVIHSERDFDEMAAWLSDRPVAGEQTGVSEESLTSSEFERFLAERAAAADSLPSVEASRPVPVTSGRSHHHRQLNKESDSENSLFAL